MADASVWFLPNVFWKLNNMSAYCKNNGPTFNFLGATWKLKFTYNGTANGFICLVALKKSEHLVDLAQKGLEITSQLISNDGTSLKQQMKLKNSTINEWIIWSITDHHCQAGGLSELFQAYHHFNCYITLESNFIPESSPQYEEQKTNILDSCAVSLGNDLGKLFNSNLMSDIVLECGDHKIDAHRSILAARSEVFAAMFRYDVTTESKKGSVPIKDLEPEILEQLVRFMYSGEVPDFSQDTVDKFYAAAEKYGVDSLKMKCALFMVNNDGTNASSKDAKGIDTEDDDAKDILSHFAYVKAILDTKEWQKLSEVKPKFAYKAFKFFMNES